MNRFNIDRLVFIILTVILYSCGASDGSGSVEDRESRDFITYYSTQSRNTDPGKYAYLYNGIPGDVAGVVNVVQGVILNIAKVENDNIQISKRRVSREINLNRVEDILENISKMDDRPLTIARHVSKQSVAICAHFAMLTCSILRHKHIPSRCRGGFENYYSATRHHDHWICEYWRAEENRWVRIDPEIDEAMRRGLNITFNSLDLPEGTFLTGADVWRFCRSGDADPTHFGIKGDGWLGGWDFVLNELVLDFMALNKVELLPWDGNRLSERDISRLRKDEFLLLDRAAELANRGIDSFQEMRELYQGNKKLQK